MPMSERETLMDYWRCETCGFTADAQTQREADDSHAYAATGCPGDGRMRQCSVEQEAQDIIDVLDMTSPTINDAARSFVLDRLSRLCAKLAPDSSTSTGRARSEESDNA